MALRWCVLLVLVALAAAQTSDAPTTAAPTTAAPTTAAPTAAESTTAAPTTAAPTTAAPTTAAPTTAAPTTAAPTTAAPTTDAPTTVAPMAAELGADGETRFVSGQAMAIRNEHFYCLGYNETTFPVDVTNSDSSMTYVRWSVFLQYPVLAYLDSVKKDFLFNQIATLINAGGGTSVNVNDFCVANVYNYQVSYYRESLLVHIYFRTGSPSIQVIDNQFRSAFMSSGDTNLVDTFQDRRAIVISTTTYGQPNQNVHPGAFSSTGRFAANQDPTLRAVVLGTYVGGATLNQALADLNLAQFAENPNPINYGLTGGDIVFVVIGTFLLALLCFLIIFGFCIQPFLM